MFSDYEQNGVVSLDIFLAYEDTIDEIGQILDDLVAAERIHVENHFQSSLSLVSQAGLVLTFVGAGAMLIAGFVGIFASRKINSQDDPAEQQGSPSDMDQSVSGPRSLPRTIVNDESKLKKGSIAA